VERYVAICHPVKSRLAFSSAGLHRAVKLILLIWIVAAVCSVPIVVQYGVVYVQVSASRRDTCSLAIMCYNVSYRKQIARQHLSSTV